MLNIHLGPHKTGTTYIQNVMKDSRWAEGYTYHDIVETTDRNRIIADLYALPRGQLPEFLADPDRTHVLSEENLIGGPGGPLKMYPAPTRNLGWAAGNGARIFFSLRRYRDLFVSAWFETLRFGPHYPFHEGPRQRGFTEVLATIERDIDPAEIVLWRFGDFRRNSEKIIRMIAGGGIVALGKPSDTSLRVTPTRELIDAYERIVPFVDPADQDKVFQSLLTLAPGKGGTRYQPFRPDDIKRLDERFEKDLEILKARYGIWAP